MSSNFKGEFGSMKRARKVPLKLRSPEPVPPKKRAKKTTTTTITTADDDDRKCRRRRQNRNPNGNARRRNTGANARKTTAIHVVARNEDGGKREEEENAGEGTNLLGFLIEATDCASPVTTDKRETIQNSKTSSDDMKEEAKTTTKSENDDTSTEAKEKEENKEEDKGILRTTRTPPPEPRCVGGAVTTTSAAARVAGAPPSMEEEDETADEALLLEDENAIIESIAKAKPKRGVIMFVQWLELLVFDLKSRVATLKRSKKRAQKAFLRVLKEEKKCSSSSSSANAANNKRDLKMLHTLEDFWDVELNETEKSLERARATLDAHKLMLTEEDKEEETNTNPLGVVKKAPAETRVEDKKDGNEDREEEEGGKEREKSILASAVAFYRTSLGLATPVRRRES